MANHGPWEPGRCGALTDPVDIYTELLRKADDALGHLTTYLNGLKRPVWLVFYGDHAPLLKSFANPFPDPRTDYVIVPLGSAKGTVAKSHAASEEAPWNLIKTIVRLAGVSRSQT
jgi:phosphoglycerol transferase MdoB-like AlkP superfamily enzyme